jgi:hypothetical protein
VLLYPHRHSLEGNSSSIVQSVQHQLHELHVTAEQQALLVQQGQVQQALQQQQQQRQARQGAAGQPLAAALDLSWSEVTHGAMQL